MSTTTAQRFPFIALPLDVVRTKPPVYAYFKLAEKNHSSVLLVVGGLFVFSVHGVSGCPAGRPKMW